MNMSAITYSAAKLIFRRRKITRCLTTRRFLILSLEAFGKIQQRKHPLNISYRDKDGIKRDYFPDFIIKTKDKMYIVETKAEDEMQKAEGDEKNLIVLKARAAVSWCKTASQVL